MGPHRGLADTADLDRAITAIRGFEWSSTNLGHVNVWFSDSWTDPLTEGGLIDPQALVEVAGPGLGDPGRIPHLTADSVRS